MPLVVLYDANVLYPATLRDVLIRIGLARLVQPKWSEQILDEVFDNLRTNRPDLDPEHLLRTRELMNASLRDVVVTGYARYIRQVELPDPDDRHVAAAAIRAKVQIIVTKNLRDFPTGSLSRWGVRAQHPDDFLCDLHDQHPEPLLRSIEAIARAWHDPQAGPEQVLDHLEVDAPSAAARLRVALRR